MKRKIRGAVYDTEAAQEIAKWESELEGVDDILYRTKSGKYFVCEVAYVDDEYRDKPGYDYVITPVSRADAIRRACDSMGVEAARPLFQDSDAGGVRQLNVRVSSRTHEILRNVAAERGVSIGRVIEELVNEGEPFGDDNVVFDEVAERHRFYEEMERKAREIMGKEKQDGVGSRKG